MKNSIRVWIPAAGSRKNIIQWCTDMFGNPHESPVLTFTVQVDNVDINITKNAAIMELVKWPTKITTGWAYRYGYFYFAEEADAMLFILKWNGKVVDNLRATTLG